MGEREMHGVDARRRQVLRRAGGLGVVGALLACGLVPAAHAQARGLFEADSLEAVLAALGATDFAQDGAMTILVPDVAEDGRTVPVGVRSSISGIEQIVLVVDKNPFIVAASMVFAPGVLPEVHTRVKMRESSRIHAIARAGGRFYRAHRDVRVVAGGCVA